jgi:hypothetical protein
MKPLIEKTDSLHTKISQVVSSQECGLERLTSQNYQSIAIDGVFDKNCSELITQAELARVKQYSKCLNLDYSI